MLGRTARYGAPLNASHHFRTTRLDAVEGHVGRLFRGAKFEIGNGVRTVTATANRYSLGHVAFAYSKLGAAVQIDIPNCEPYALLFAFTGKARAQADGSDVDIGANRALIGSGASTVRLNYDASFEHLLLTIAPAALTTKLEAVIGETVSSRLSFVPQADFRRADTDNIRRMFFFLAERLERSTSSLHPLALQEFEQSVIVSFLMANDNNYNERLHGPIRLAAPWQVRRAEAYIEANWDQALAIEALVLATGLSARTLFHTFRKSRNYSPMEFARRIRLDRAREMLQEADISTTVTSVAFACGFGNLGHFAGYYQRAFGETPSTTLRNRLSYRKTARTPWTILA